MLSYGKVVSISTSSVFAYIMRYFLKQVAANFVFMVF
jgi:hypothetical protein